jgi:hypothetical protein
MRLGRGTVTLGTVQGQASLLQLRRFILMWAVALTSSPKLLWEIEPVLWCGMRVCVRAIETANGHFFSSTGSLHTGRLQGQYTNDDGGGIAIINDGITITHYIFALEDLVAEPFLFTIPNLKIISLPNFAQVYTIIPIPLPWPAKDIVRKAVNVSGS